MHATAVLPLGLWFGCLAWWSRSVIPAMIAHVINNLFAIYNARQQSSPPGDSVGGMEELTTLSLAGYALSLVMLLAGLYSLSRERAARQIS